MAHHQFLNAKVKSLETKQHQLQNSLALIGKYNKGVQEVFSFLKHKYKSIKNWKKTNLVLYFPLINRCWSKRVTKRRIKFYEK